MNNQSVRKAIVVTVLTAGLAFGLEWHRILPQQRNFSSIIADTLNQRLVMFGGGRGPGRSYLNDVWQIVSAGPEAYAWNQLAPTGTPPIDRWGHLAVYDPANQRMLVGTGNVSGGRINDIWALDLTLGSESWEQLSPSGTPPCNRSSSYCIYHPGRRSVIVFGGGTSGGVCNDLWELKLHDFT